MRKYFSNIKLNVIGKKPNNALKYHLNNTKQSMLHSDIKASYSSETVCLQLTHILHVVNCTAADLEPF